jgi:hypothetical protein
VRRRGVALEKLVDFFPMTVTGQVQKFRMREELGLELTASILTA